MPFEGVSFDDDRQRGSRTSITERQMLGGMTGWLINHHIVTNEAQAKAVLLIVAIIFFGLSIVVFFINVGTDTRKNGDTVPQGSSLPAPSVTH